MSGMQIFIEGVLVVLLIATLIYAIRLERALGVLRQSRGALEPLVDEFDAGTRQAEAAITRLRETAEGAGRQISRQADAAMTLKDDLAFLVERGDRLADRLDTLVRRARPLAVEPPRLVSDRAMAEQLLSGRMRPELPSNEYPSVERASAERASAERLVAERAVSERAVSERAAAPRGAERGGERAERSAERSQVRSQAERDLLKALRMAR